MIQELRHRVDSLLASGTTRYDDAVAALRDRWRVLYEMAEVMFVDFLLYGAEQFGLEHGLSWMERKREGRIARRARLRRSLAKSALRNQFKVG
jgi:hypothetical protein